MRNTPWPSRIATPRSCHSAKRKVANKKNKFNDKNSKFYTPFNPSLQASVEKKAQGEVKRLLINSNALLHGDPLGKKGDDCCRLIGENMDGAAAWKRDNPKATQIRNLMERTNADRYFGSEVNSNFGKIRDPCAFLQSTARSGNVSINMAWNMNENDARYQVGGTCSIVRDGSTEFISSQGRDDTELGRWCWTLLQGQDCHRTRIISAYMPVHNNRDLGSTYRQQRRFSSKEELWLSQRYFQGPIPYPSECVAAAGRSAPNFY